MTTLTRRRRASDDMPDEERLEQPTRRGRRTPSGDDKGAGVADEPRRGRRNRDEDADDEPKRPSRRRNRDEDEDDSPRRSSGGRRGRAAGGFGAYESKRKSTSKFAEEFRPSKDNAPSLIKLLDAEPFDIYNQHWIEEGDASGKTRHSFVCYDDEDYFPDSVETGCPLCDVGDSPNTYALWNVLNLENPRKPVLQIWKTSNAVTEKLQRMADSKRTSPLDRVDLYLEVTRVKKGRKINFDVEALKAEDAEEEYDFDAFDEDELAEYEDSKFDDRKSVTQIDTFDDLADLAESLD